jgi:outer membrane protein TolC
MERSVWAWMPVVAWLLCWVDPAPSAAQAPVQPSSVPPAVNPRSGRTGVQSPPLPPPTVPPPATSLPSAVVRDSRPSPLPLPPAAPSASYGASSTGAPALATNLNLKPAPLEPTDLRFPINLATALRLSDARPLIVAAAQASVWVAEAELTRSKVLWVPMLNLGFDYTRHDGGGPDFNKGIMTAPSVNFFYGGAGMWGGMDGIQGAEAIFQPLVQRQMLNSAHWDIQSAKNDAVMMTSDAYFRVHQYRGMFAGALYSVERGRDLVERVRQLSKELVPAVEVDRARNMLADLEQQAVSARQEWRVASADLTQVLRLDPRAVVVPLEHDHTQVTLIDPSRSLDDLMPIALTNRPELASHQALVTAMMESVRREKFRPLVPNLYINGFQTPYEMLQGGIFGLGPNSSLNQWRGRADLSYQPMWQLEAFGIGNLARIKEQRGMQSMAIIEFFRTQDTVAGDVTRALARVQSAAARVIQADRAMRTAIITFNGNFEGLQQTTRLGSVLVLVNRPQEAVFALQLLKVAFDQYFTTVAEYNRAQFEMFHALGYPAREVTAQFSPGDLKPVDTERPPYLPPVGNGPPPATR